MKHLNYFEANKYNKSYDIDDVFKYINIGNIKMIKKIISTGVDVNSYSSRTYPAIQLAIYYSYDNFKIFDFLLECGADIDAINTNNGNTTLIDFSMNSNLSNPKDIKILYHIIDKGANWCIKNFTGYDFIDAINSNYTSERILSKTEKQNIIEDIIKKYPDKYEDYLMKKNANKYNL
jgi:ankyrin repeat protein